MTFFRRRRPGRGLDPGPQGEARIEGALHVEGTLVCGGWTYTLNGTTLAAGDSIIVSNNTVHVQRDNSTYQISAEDESVADCPDPWWISDLNEEARDARARYAEAFHDGVWAKERATELLVTMLTPAQRETWEAGKYVYLRGRSGRLYCVIYGHSQNVYTVDVDGRFVWCHCAYPTGNLPIEDSMLSQILALRFSEREFLKAAQTFRCDWTPDYERIGQ